MFAILDHIEKYVGWRFHREEGRRVGRQDGKVVYAVHLPREVKVLFPENFKGIEGVEFEVDESPGKGKQEGESTDYHRIDVIVCAKERFAEVKGDIVNIKTWAEEELARIDALAAQERVRIGERLLEIYKLLDQTTGVQMKIVESQNIEIQRSMLAAIPGQDAEESKPSIADAKDPYEMMYR